MRAEDFAENSPGRLVRTIANAWAFVPDPLPANVELEPDTIQLLASAENGLGRLAGTTSREFNPCLVGSPLLRREAILSSRIEGTVTTPERLALFEAETSEQTTSAERDPDTREVLNYVRAIQHGLQRLSALPVSLRLIKEIHGVLLRGVRGDRERPGEFRTEQNYIRGHLGDDIINARYVPPPVRQMNEGLDQFERYLNQDQAPDRDPLLVQMALIHYQFEAIHPFRDGNGRIGRLLIPLLMCASGRLESPILYASAYFERHRERYMDLLLRVSQRNDWHGWINFFLSAIRESADEANVQAVGLLDLRQKYHRSFQTSRSSALLIRLIDRLFQMPSITINQAAALLDVTHQAATNNVRKLVSAGILRERTGRRRNQVFIADEILSFMDEAQDHAQPRD